MYEKINNAAESPYFLLPAKWNLLLPLGFSALTAQIIKFLIDFRLNEIYAS
jgi:hypothetical protein